MAGDDDNDALDRAAILARRQRFIALALSGLAAGCGDDGNTTGPQPCLDAPPPTESSAESLSTTDATASMSGPVEGSGTDDGSSTSGTSGMPMPCLDVAPDSSSGTTDGSTTGTTTTTTGDTGSDSGSESTGKPLPCLGVVP